MKIENYQFPKSSFLSLEKDFALIFNKIIKNDRIIKLLHYDDRDALNKPITAENKAKVLEKQIKNLPKIHIEPDIRSFINVSFDSFVENETNPEFRDNLIYFDIICHVEQWPLDNFALRPYKIAGELDYMFNKQRLTGIGVLEFVRAQQMTVNDDFVMVSLIYRTVHGEEDKVGMLNPKDEQQFIDDFNKIYNS